ncbi:enoyl-CoA hydratase [Mycolicibacterium chitae]|uniref:Enoyl-CoA hydratase/isomerase n=1 Tax=Mycolicibacterium chitae TaxID=1792 RepID=A0A3S4RCX3_MYCCI|nr:enoyl-CoA hydratase-related protein [Mycolicibacterium chitae]MCV7106294.1 enoyl-CoA hydratase/isomerase family protein [Mycolicibacterium chitae]BBZ03791.1 enoyl-CoA hydratase [Mycolicibacterium chitae]VEG47445.1 enoyl-CoA hydratase/isomerase [Mycolicibacterium chitae]
MTTETFATVTDGVVRAVLPLSDDGLISLDDCDRFTELLMSPPESAHIVVIESRAQSFCLGRERSAATVHELPDEVDRLVAVNHALRNSPLVSVARVHGDAAGFGVGVAALSDIAVAADTAKFFFPEVNIGLAPTLVLAWLPQLVGRREAFRLTATGAAISAERAAALGLVSETATAADLDARVDAVVQELRRHNPRVHREIRDFLRATDQATEAQATELAKSRLVIGSLRRQS